MSNLSIKGRGVYIAQTCLDKGTVDMIIENGELPEDFFECTEEYGEVDTLCSGFYQDAHVFLGSINIGTVESLIQKANTLGINSVSITPYSDSRHLAEIIEGTNSEGFVLDSRFIEGTFFNGEIPHYSFDSDDSINQFIADFANHLREEIEGVYYIQEWNGAWLENQVDLDNDFYECTFFYKGKEIVLH